MLQGHGGGLWACTICGLCLMASCTGKGSASGAQARIIGDALVYAVQDEGGCWVACSLAGYELRQEHA